VPFTPFHFGPGAALHSVAPKHVSFLAFCGANVLVDVEPLYYMLSHQYPLHRFFHTYVGVSVVVAATIAAFLIARWISRMVRMPNLFEWQELALRGVLVGSALGGYSHIALDSVMHPDIRPLAPFSDANALYLRIGISQLHWGCLAAGIVGLVILGFRRDLKGL
jgi:membrane-bound metal-dependent hydrolase YbcI (DUF457 family)